MSTCSRQRNKHWTCLFNCFIKRVLLLSRICFTIPPYCPEAREDDLPHPDLPKATFAPLTIYIQIRKKLVSLLSGCIRDGLRGELTVSVSNSGWRGLGLSLFEGSCIMVCTHDRLISHWPSTPWSINGCQQNVWATWRKHWETKTWGRLGSN